MAETASRPAPDIFIADSPRARTIALQLPLCRCAGTNPHIGEVENFLGLFTLYDDVLKSFDSKTAHYLSRDELFYLSSKPGARLSQNDPKKLATAPGWCWRRPGGRNSCSIRRK